MSGPSIDNSAGRPNSAASSVLFSDVAADFLLHIRHERGYSQKTVFTYRHYIQAFANWVSDEGFREPTVATAFTTPLLRRHLYALSQKGRQPRTIRTAFNALRSLGTFCVENGVLDESPVHVIRMPKKNAARRSLVSDEELAALLLATERQVDERKVALSRALLSCLIYCGLRLGELLSLRTEDVKLSDGVLLVRHGKGDKSRMLYPNKVCLQALAAWLSIRPADNHTEWLWAYGRQRRLAENGIYKMLEEVKAIAGLAGNAAIKPHAIRHAFATRMMRQGIDIKSIQAALGHSDAATTLIYLHVSEQPARAMATLPSLCPADTTKVTKPSRLADAKTQLGQGQIGEVGQSKVRRVTRPRRTRP